MLSQVISIETIGAYFNCLELVKYRVIDGALLSVYFRLCAQSGNSLWQSLDTHIVQKVECIPLGETSNVLIMVELSIRSVAHFY